MCAEASTLFIGCRTTWLLTADDWLLIACLCFRLQVRKVPFICQVNPQEVTYTYTSKQSLKAMKLPSSESELTKPLGWEAKPSSTLSLSGFRATQSPGNKMLAVNSYANQNCKVLSQHETENWTLKKRRSRNMMKCKKYERILGLRKPPPPWFTVGDRFIPGSLNNLRCCQHIQTNIHS